MDKVTPATAPGNDSDDRAQPECRIPKRKEYETEDSLLDIATFDCKRRREDYHRASSRPFSFGTVVTSDSGGSCHVDTEFVRGKTLSRRFPSTGRPRHPPYCHEGRKADFGSNSFDGAFETTSVYGSGLGCQSTVTSSSNDEEESRLVVHNSVQTSKVVGETNIVNLRSSLESTCSASIDRQVRTLQKGASEADIVVFKSVTETKCPGKNVRQVGSLQEGKKRLENGFQRHRRKSRISDHSEVRSPLSNCLTSCTASEEEQDRDFLSRLRDVRNGNSTGGTETVSVGNSGCSSVKAGREERGRGNTDDDCPKHQHKDSSEAVYSSCGRDFQSSSVVTDVCVSSCSDSRFSGLRTSFKHYLSKKPSFLKESVETPSQKNSASADASLADDGPFVANEYMGTRSEAPPGSSVSAPAESSGTSDHEQENYSSASEGKYLRDGGPEQNPPPIFVLSSGRLSKEQQEKHGLRPTTIDDDFEKYFAQLML